MISIEIEARDGRQRRWTLRGARPCQCFDLARRLLRRAGVWRCRCRNGGFVTDIGREGYQTRRDLSVAIGE